MFKKKIGIYALTFAMAAMGMTGCSSGSSGNSASELSEVTTQAANTANYEPFSVVCTIFPEYDWVREILGDHADNVDISYLLDCNTVFTLENSNKDIANAIINNSGKKGVKIAELNSLQSVSKDDISGGASYLSLMQKNYDVLAGVMK